MPAKRRDDKDIRRVSRAVGAGPQATCTKGALVQGGMLRCNVGDEVLVLGAGGHDGQRGGAHGGELSDGRHDVSRMAVGVADGKVPGEGERVMATGIVAALMGFVAVVVMGMLLAHCAACPVVKSLMETDSVKKKAGDCRNRHLQDSLKGLDYPASEDVIHRM
ncbi:hypothetical protein G7Z17_g13376 [Cylindrodendrum hubeiense]|uniref:Uncharacterized protein n=1 Tax=Cylindrodendrum hubeiense TaxID=595255 RepID=A0A9P5GVY8_9HYPO|nr:hypothetical protein G7Z17_g13376 [Cylindrodendrum hubeiense]